MKTPKKKYKVKWFIDDWNPNPLFPESRCDKGVKQTMTTEEHYRLLDIYNQYKTNKERWVLYRKVLKLQDRAIQRYQRKQKWNRRKTLLKNWFIKIYAKLSKSK